MEATAENKDFEKMHMDALYWNSMLDCYDKELQFVEKLLNAKLYKPNIPNFFEHLQELKQTLKNLKEIISEFSNEIKRHEKEMRGLVDCLTISCDIIYQQRHREIESRFKEKSIKFQIKKLGVFEYLESALA